MTEREYIDATDLAKVNAIWTMLGSICWPNQAAITEEEMNTVASTVNEWQQRLFKKVIVKGGLK